ncbi:MAG: flavin reductase [Caldilineaceae bacterium]|nr:flavin reductase [Caldilineaceae bacterium]
MDPKAFRNALGRFASGVTVVTTVVDDKVHGMTASAFVSVSLDPPLVLVSVDKRAHLHAMLQEGSRYGVSILSGDQADYSQHFAGFGAPDLAPEFVWQDGIPLLKEALTHLVTTVVDAHEAGDHTLFIARVEHLDWADGDPLLYFRGKYGDFQAKA